MRIERTIICLALLALAGCGKSKPVTVAEPEKVQTPAPQAEKSATATPAKVAMPRLDACSLLTSEEVQSVLGEPVKETKPSGRSQPAMEIAQCYFALPTPSKSMVLTVFSKGASGDAHELREVWEEMFHREHPEKEHERGEEGEKKSKPEKVEGVGDEAWWTGNAVGGVLYVLKGDKYIRVSVGGPDDKAGKMKKSQAIAELVLKRL